MAEGKTELDRLVKGLPPLLKEEAQRYIAGQDFISFLGEKGAVVEGEVWEIHDILGTEKGMGREGEAEVEAAGEGEGEEWGGRVSPASGFGERLILLLPPGLPAEALLKACLPKGVAFRQAGDAARRGAAKAKAVAEEAGTVAAEGREAIALDFAAQPPERIREGLSRIAAALAEFTARSCGG